MRLPDQAVRSTARSAGACARLCQPSTLRMVLTNPAYAGLVYGNRWHRRGTLERRSATAPAKHSAMSRVDAPREEWILVAEIPPLVSREQFDRVQARLVSNRRFARRNNKAHPYLLRNLVSCGLCGLACLARTAGRQRYYSCTGKLPALFSHREPGRAAGRAGLGRPVRSAGPSRAGLPGAGAGAWRAMAAAGTSGAPAGATAWTGEPGAAARAPDGRLPRRRGAAGRVPSAPG